MKKQLDLSVLKYVDSAALERIADNTPSVSMKHMERIFTESEKKYQYRILSPEQMYETETWEAEPIKKSGILFQTASVAACLLVCAGTAGGSIYMLHHGKNMQDMPSAEVTETETSVAETEKKSETETTVIQPAKAVTETDRPVVKQTEKTTVQAFSAPETEPQTTAQTKPVITETVSVPAVQTRTELITEIIPEEIQAPEPETQVIIQETEAPAPETEPLTEIQPETETSDSGFRIEKEEVFDTDTGEFSNYWNMIYPASLENAAENFDTLYAPTWLPDGWTLEEISTGDELLDEMRQANKEFMEQAIRNGTTTAYETSYLPVDENGNFRQASSIEFYQYLKTTDNYIFGITSSEPDYEVFTPFTINGKNGLLVNYGDDDEPEDQRTISVLWDNGDYIFMIQTFSNTFAEAVRIAESVQPVG